MPAFNTKTIQSILEPVAQQVSKLVILQEESDDDGNEMPDLSMLVHIVKQAADNLIRVGYETSETSDDATLKQEMPIALKQVEEACNALIEASDTLKQSPKSSIGKKKLILGERGILQGVSSILLSFDQSEVRKIINLCKQVLEYLSITELIEKMDDLVMYVKNLTPILTKMTREIDSREKELTDQVHRAKLIQHLEQVKNLTPSFISSIKIYLLTVKPLLNEMNTSSSSSSCLSSPTLSAKNEHSDDDEHQRHEMIINSVEQSKNFLIKRLSCEINEMIRILQLTAFDEDKQGLGYDKIEKMNNFEIRLQNALEWLGNDQAVCNSNGEKSLRNALEDAILLSNKQLINQANNDFNKDNIVRLLNQINITKHQVDEVCNLIKQGKRRTSHGMSLAQKISENLVEIRSNLKKNQSPNDQGEMMKPEANLFGIIDQMCHNPITILENNLGVQAAQFLIEEGRQLALRNYDASFRDEFLNVCYECEFLLNKLMRMQETANHQKIEPGHDASKFIAKELKDRLNFLGLKIKKSLVDQVADGFLDINYPIRKLIECATSSSDNRGELIKKFNSAAADFNNHTQNLCSSAQQLINSVVQPKNKETSNHVNELIGRILELTPQVKNAAYIVLTYPNNRTCYEHLELMKNEWQTNAQRLQRLVDETVDCGMFIRSCETAIVRETNETQMAVRERNNAAIITNALNIARRSNRIIQVANQEAENSDDVDYVNRILNANETMKLTLPVMIHKAKLLATQPDISDNYQEWSSSNKNLLAAIKNVRLAVSANDIDDSMFSPSPRSTKLEGTEFFNEKSGLEYGGNYEQNAMPRLSFQKPNYPSRPTPLPDLIEENETELPDPKADEPILMAAHDLHLNVNQWYSRDNNMIAVAKNITHLMAKLSSLLKEGSNCSKKELIATARMLAEESMELRRIAILLAQDCTDKRMRLNLLHVSDRIPTIGAQLKILSTVKATMLGSQASKEDEEATEMLIGNANNLNMSVKATIAAAKSASIKIRTDSGMKLRWIRKGRQIEQF